MIEALIVGMAAFGWLFWAIAFVAVAALALSASTDSPGWFVAVLLGAGVALLFASGHNLVDAWNYLNAHPLDILKWTAAYIGIGVLYAALRWWIFLRDLKSKLKDWRASSDKYRTSSDPLTPEDRKKFTNAIDFYKNFPPRVSEHKGSVMGWMILWSFAWAELRPITKLFNFVYSGIASALQGMSDRMFKGLA